jgi:putative sigma-54 modulation protein
MKINIHGDKVKITEGIKSYIEKKLSKLNVYFDNPNEINAKVIVRVRNLEQIVEVTVPTKRFTLRSEESHSDLYAAIDLVVDKLERQIRKNKTKFERYKKQEIIDFNIDFEIEEKEVESKIVKRKGINMKPMDEDEAILQMELLNHDFFVFNNIDEDCISVIYKRKEGNFGIINTK